MERIVVRKGTYHDSAFLMRVARELKNLAHVSEAVVLMGTPMNRSLLVNAGFTASQLDAATPMDMVVALRAENSEALDGAEKELARLIQGGSPSTQAGAPMAYGDVLEAAQAHPESNLVSVSVPGPYAAYVAKRALDAGRHVFLFSNNVPLEDELSLKKRAREEGLLVMGPDCGTAIINGVGLGFANRVPRGRIGLVGASGTGLQEASCLLAHLGEGVSHAIGTGSRDLSAQVEGAMAEMGLRLLGGDADTKVILLVAKHPAPAVADRMHALLKEIGKPAVVRYLGKPAPTPTRKDGVHYVSTLDDAALAAVALARGQGPTTLDASDIQALATRILGTLTKVEGRMVGLFGGGSLAAEARLILEERGVTCVEPDHPLKLNGPIEEAGHLVVDTGEDFYTVGKPHPMVDQTVRCALLKKALTDPSVGLVVLDLVLGDGSHPNPAPELVTAATEGRWARGKKPVEIVASVCGVDADPQNASRQKEILSASGIHVQPSAARAALLCAALLGAEKRSAS